MVLKPLRRSLVPSPLEESRKFDEFATQYFNKCDDLLSYTRRYPVIKETDLMVVQRQNRNPNEEHRWLRREVYLTTRITTYEELKHVLFLNRTENLPNWLPLLQKVESIESIVPNLCEVYRYCFKSQGFKAKRDYCQLVLKREFLGETAVPKPRIFTPSASVANLALTMNRSMSTTNLNNLSQAKISGYHQGSHVNLSNMYDGYSSGSPAMSPPLGYPNSPPMGNRGMKNAKSFIDLHDPELNGTSSGSGHYAASMSGGYNGNSPYMQQSKFAGLSPPQGQNLHMNDNDSMDGSDVERKPVRRFQVITVPLLHRNCTEQRGYVRAYYETYEEVREYSNGDVEWSCIHHSDFSGWIPSFLSDSSIASAFPKEAESLVEYVAKCKSLKVHQH